MLMLSPTGGALRHSRSPILLPIESPCDFLSVINTNLPLFRDIAFDRPKIAIFGYPSCV